jgi:uncharacterized repeat protein (TIGR02543 family)
MFTASTSVTADITVYAQWTKDAQITSPVTPTAPAVYTVTFDGNGADVQAKPGSVAVTAPDTTVKTLPTEPVRSGYAFARWNTRADGGGSVFTATTPVTADITVYAQWTKDALITPAAYTVVFDGNGADVQAKPGSASVIAPDTTVKTLPTEPVRKGYTFNHWNRRVDGSGGMFTASTSVTADITVYAQWTKDAADSGTQSGTTDDATGSTTSVPPANTPITPPVEPPATSPENFPVGNASNSGGSTAMTGDDGETGNPLNDESQPDADSDVSNVSAPRTEKPFTPTEDWKTTEQRYKEATVPVLDIGGSSIPLFGLEDIASWSLINLLCALAGLAIGVFIIVKRIRRKKLSGEALMYEDFLESAYLKDDENDDAKKRKKRRNGLICFIGALVLALIGILIVVLTQNIASHMVLFDKWTLLAAVILALESLLAWGAFPRLSKKSVMRMLREVSLHAGV